MQNITYLFWECTFPQLVGGYQEREDMFEVVGSNPIQLES